MKANNTERVIVDEFSTCWTTFSHSCIDIKRTTPNSLYTQKSIFNRGLFTARWLLGRPSIYRACVLTVTVPSMITTVIL